MSPQVVVVGAGASGTLTAARLLEQGLHVTLVGDEPAGQGPAYRTSDPRHLLNVPAAKMSARPDSPADFLDWARTRLPDVGPSDFLPRALYGDYLAAHLHAVAAQHPRLTRLLDTVVAVDPVRLASGGELTADAVVLALGNAEPCAVWVPDGLRASDRYVPDPWVPGALDAVPDEGDVLLIGSGLSGVDVALTLARAGRVVHLVSRNGLVPTAHAATPLPPCPPPCLDGVSGLPALKEAVHAHLFAAADWRAGMDSLRPLTQRLWASLSAPEQEEFARDDARLWDVHRHRMSPTTHGLIAGLTDSGAVSVSKGELVDLDGTRAGLVDGRVLDVVAVVNCTGSQPDLRKTDDPLADHLLSTGARVGPLGWGLDTAPDGRVLGSPGLWTLGPLRRGSLWESTAIPEIRCQAADLALSIAADLAALAA